MLTMLHAAAACGIVPDYLTRLLAAFPATLKAEPRTRNVVSAKLPPASHVPPLVEPLSSRELEVLRLIADGKANAEIAQTLVIALSTVKTHTNSIFGKLQVTSRTQALARARSLQLI
jgi:LuxR family maltose regulon positive regulatory protein